MKPKVKVRVQFGAAPAAKPAPEAAPEPPRVTRVARLLALAWWLDEEIRAGRIKNLAEAARELGLTRARVTQIAALRLLAPRLQARILFGHMGSFEQPEIGARVIRGLLSIPVWREQLAVAGFNLQDPNRDPDLRKNSQGPVVMLPTDRHVFEGS